VVKTIFLSLRRGKS